MNELTEEQKKYIRENYIQIPDVDRLTKNIFQNESLDGRNKEGKLVAAYMLEMGYKYKTKVHKKVKKISFTVEQEDLMKEYAKDGLNSIQIAQLTFQDREVKNLSAEQRAVADFLKTNNPDFVKTNKDINEDFVYSPPKSNEKIIKKIIDYTGEEFQKDFDLLKRDEREMIVNLKKYLSSPRFTQLMNTYTNVDAKLFEAEFVRATWDKSDLTADEINLYINVCVDYINLKTIQKNMEKLNRMFDDVEDQTEMSVKLAEILKAKSAEYHQCEQRQESLIKKLNGDRSARMKNRQEKFASILSLVQSFQEEEERSRMIELAEKQKLLVGEEAEKLENMDSWKARVLGLRKKDII